ncbi:MAG: hypothetical protein M1812_000533 [Candelaria pacifica]|nr:MAG: hypothetical protein M1812_000533 [Candelaria pacifica]
MAALISAANAKIRSHPVLNYFCSTHFWGPVSNFGIPIAAIMDAQKDPEMFGGREKSLAEQAKAGVNEVRKEGEGMLQVGKEKSQEAISKGKGMVKETKDRIS